MSQENTFNFLQLNDFLTEAMTSTASFTGEVFDSIAKGPN